MGVKGEVACGPWPQSCQVGSGGGGPCRAFGSRRKHLAWPGSEDRAGAGRLGQEVGNSRGRRVWRAQNVTEPPEPGAAAGLRARSGETPRHPQVLAFVQMPRPVPSCHGKAAGEPCAHGRADSGPAGGGCLLTPWLVPSRTRRLSRSFSFPGSPRPLQVPPEFPETQFLCTLPVLSPQDSGDPESEPALITEALDLREHPAKLTPFTGEELSPEKSSNCSRSHSEPVAKKWTPGLWLTPGGAPSLFFLTSLQERRGSPFSLLPGPLGAQLCAAADGSALAPGPFPGRLQWLLGGPGPWLLFGRFFRKVSGG